ncbi:competence protein CoiA family protein [Cupriavidus necator]|uniref:competence protein CoiA family protein n=1 Tax=Cupriavidus necator TaxID=106590 RepID=UPI003ECCC7A8
MTLLGSFVMACCPAPAVLKTSPNGVQFFAHASGECTTAPETVWHQTGKALVVAAVRSLGLACREEVSGGAGRATWRADTHFQIGARTVVIELQRSYQHLREFQRRQARYRAAGVECYWLIRQEQLSAVAGAISRKRLKEEFGGKFPPGSFYPHLPDLPWALLEANDPPRVRGPVMDLSVNDWIAGIIAGRYLYREGKWAVY